MAKFFDNFTAYKLALIVFLVIVALLLFRPDVAERTLDAIKDVSAPILDALNFGGTE